MFELGNDPYCQRETDRRKHLKEHVLPSIQSGDVGVVFSPVLYADSARDVVLAKFAAKVKEMEIAGHTTVLGETADWQGIAQVRDAVRRDITLNPLVYADVNKTEVSLGDCAIVYAALKNGCTQLWTWDPLLIKCSKRQCVRGLEICEPKADTQFSLFS